MYLSATITSLLETHAWRLLYKQIIDDHVVKHRCDDIKYVFIGEIDKYFKLINAENILVCYKLFVE